MDAAKGQTEDSGQPHQVASTNPTPVDTAWRTYLRHTSECGACRLDGVDCATAERRKQAWRAARREARDGS
jgi:hypothetical protein